MAGRRGGRRAGAFGVAILAVAGALLAGRAAADHDNAWCREHHVTGGR